MSINNTATNNQTRSAPYQTFINVCKTLLKPFQRKVEPLTLEDSYRLTTHEIVEEIDQYLELSKSNPMYHDYPGKTPSIHQPLNLAKHDSAAREQNRQTRQAAVHCEQKLPKLFDEIDINHPLVTDSQNINERIVGLSITHPITLSNNTVLFDEALIHHSGEHCICPLSGGRAVINAGFLYSFKLKKLIIPIVTTLHDTELMARYKKLGSTKRRLSHVAKNPDQRQVYAFVMTIRHRIGADIPAKRFKKWLYAKTNVVAGDEVMKLIDCSSRARINQAKRLTALNPRHFKNRLHLPQKNGRLDWSMGVEMAKQQRYKLVAVKAQHGQGKTQDFMKQLFQHSSSLGGAVAIAHRRKLVAQLSQVFGCLHYDEDKKWIAAAGRVKDLACCLHSFKHEIYLNHLRQAHAIFIDEASQALKAFYTDKNIEEGLAKKFAHAAKEAPCIYLLDADLTEHDIHRWATLLEIERNDILVITAEPPVRDFTIHLTCSTSQKYYKNTVIDAIRQDLLANTPCVLAVESEANARVLHRYFTNTFPGKKITLLSGKLPAGEINPFIKNIQVEMASTDLLIHTSVIGTGVSIEHPDKRFKKGYGLFSGTILSATECLQMLRRCRDVTTWEVSFLCRPGEMFMTSFYKDIGSIELGKILPVDEIKGQVLMEREQNRALFIHAFRNLLEDYQIKLVEQYDIPECEIEGLMSSAELTAQDINDLLNAKPCSLDHAQHARKRGYQDREEMLRSESALLAHHYKTSQIGLDEAQLACDPQLKSAAQTMERLVTLLRGEKGDKVKDLLNRAGISLDLFKKQRLTQDHIRTLRDSIASQCAELVRLGFLKERYVKAEKIPEETPIKFIKEVLKSWGLVVETKRATNDDRELDISVPMPMAQRLGLDIRTDKEKLQDEAITMKNNGFSLSQIGNALGITKSQTQRLLNTLAYKKPPLR